MKITKRPPSNDGISNSYISATEKILNSLSGTNPQSVKVGFEKTLRETVASLDAANAAAVGLSVADGTKASQRRFVSGLAAMFEGGTLTVSNLSAIGFDIKNPRAAQDVLDRKAQDVNATAVYRRNFLELRSKLVGASRDLQSEVNGVLDKSSDGGDYKQSLDALKDNLIKRGCFSVQYSNGASVGVDKYASMVCRSARTESANTENLRISKAFGTDLVECVGSSVTCKVCAQYRGRVFSISGEDKRYPPLRDGANSPLKNGYDVIHPNCRCEFRPYFETLHSEKENGEKRKFSNRLFDGDKRTEAQAKAYQQRQAENRRALEEQSRWNELQALLGKDNPYTNLSSMRRALDADKDSFAYKASHNIKDDYAQYKEWTDIVGQKNMPKSLAEFQELKYNDNDKFEQLEGFKEYRADNPKATPNDYQKVVKLKEAGIKGEIHIPPRELTNINSYGFDDDHINVERKHNVTEQEAKQFVNNAVVSISKWNGKFERYYSYDGATYVDCGTKIIRTAYSKNEFDENTIKIFEELNKYERG